MNRTVPQAIPPPWPLFTDQECCFDTQGMPISCKATGQDADRRLPRPGSAVRFAATHDIVADALTGLIWSRDANRFGFPYSLDEAIGICDAMNQQAVGGISNWRLPSRRELFSVISHQHINPALGSDAPFRNVFHSYCWTATPCARLPDQAWYILITSPRGHTDLFMLDGYGRQGQPALRGQTNVPS